MKEKSDKKQLIIGILIGALVMGIAMLIVVIGVVRKANRTYLQESTFVSTTDSVLDEETVKKIEQVQSVFDGKSVYDVDNEKLKEGMIDGLVAGSGDVYAEYLTPEELQDRVSTYNGTIYGIGVLMGPDENKNVYIHKVYDDSPAEKAGIHAGDYIIKVDGEDVSSLSLDDIVSRVRGELNTKVVITVYREDDMAEHDITVIRGEIPVEVIDYKMLDDEIGYIHIEEWYDTTSGQFEKAYSDLESQNMKALVIDLRSNTGGLVKAAVDVLEQFLPPCDVLYIEDNTGKRTYYKAYDSDEIDVPIVILTNAYTASASEIFVGALKDYDKAVTIGTKTYGKGVVQSFISLYDGSALKLTTERYFTPSGTALDGNGIDPDIEVEFDSEAYYDEENPVDNQLEEAVNYLKDKGGY
ncbi:MAG: S41 family peptidase [Lachnospiraceae bacterium]|nr:S41 family peptidase [Lachnospiraceae bacterium]